MKRSDRYSNSNEHFEHMKHEPHYNTYYQPVGKPPKKKTNTIENIINHSNHYRIVYWYHVFFIYTR